MYCMGWIGAIMKHKGGREIVPSWQSVAGHQIAFRNKVATHD